MTGPLLTNMTGLVGVASNPYYTKILFAEGEKLYLPATQKKLTVAQLNYSDEWAQGYVWNIERISFVLKCNSE